MTVLRLASCHPDALLPHRNRPRWTCCATPTATWLRLPVTDTSLAAQIPTTGIFSENANGSLTPQALSLPTEPPPAGPWLPLTELIPVTPASCLLPATTENKLPFLVSHAGPTPPASALLASAGDLLHWAASASRFRMQTLTFAASTSMAFVRGTPLPPINGTSFHFDGPLAIPSGYALAAHIDPSWVARAIPLPASAIALVFPPGEAEIIGPEAFVTLSLAALRRSFPATPA